jgi:hypothetical protein
MGVSANQDQNHPEKLYQTPKNSAAIIIAIKPEMLSTRILRALPNRIDPVGHSANLFRGAFSGFFSFCLWVSTWVRKKKRQVPQ